MSAPPVPPTINPGRCGDRAAFALQHDKELEETTGQRSQPTPECIAGAITFCDGPKGHTGEHVGAIMGGQFICIWTQFPLDDGTMPWRIIDHEGNE